MLRKIQSVPGGMLVGYETCLEEVYKIFAVVAAACLNMVHRILHCNLYQQQQQ